MIGRPKRGLELFASNLSSHPMSAPIPALTSARTR
jgi:hypothetical protein